MMLNKPFRYDFFTIWGNGFSHKDEILDMFRLEEHLEILRIELRKIDNMQKFVFKLYACDSVPPQHLHTKLQYLFQVHPEILIIFVKNYNPQEMPVGEGEFRKIQCHYINGIKKKVRNQFNPRHSDRNYQLNPLDMGVSHEHVIHASDCEEQVDYFLKMLGYKKGIKFLTTDRENFPFKKPYYLKTPKKYIFKSIRIDHLMSSILEKSDSAGIIQKKKNISETPHYRGINRGSNEYIKYIDKFKYTLLTDFYSWKKLKKLNELDIDQIIKFDRIIVEKESDYYMILDGVHRAAISLNHNLKHIKCLEFIY